MEDPWANAWGEPAKPAEDTREPWSLDSNPSLSPLDNQAAIAVPSWTSDRSQWNDEPLEDQPGIQLSNESADDWGTADHDPNVVLNRHSLGPIHNTSRSSTPEVAEEITSDTASSAASPKSVSVHVPHDDETLLPVIPASISLPPPASGPSSPDAFGTFETGLDAGEADLDPWAQPLPSDASKGQDVWATSHTTSSRGEPAERVDEWESAKRQKEKQDQHVPPHILASIHSELMSLAGDLWPPAQGSQSEDPTDVVGWQKDMIDIEGLPAVERLIPQDLTLPPYVAFQKTFTKKHMGDALRLTRHVPIVQSSPFNLYLSSKGSTAWESSVRNKVEVASDDFLPSGWRVLEKDKEEAKHETDVKKKPTTGFLSFFGRKSSATSLKDSPRRSESPKQEPKSPSTTTPKAITPTHSTRTSIDISKPQLTQSLSSTPAEKPPSPLPLPPDLTTPTILSGQSLQTSSEQAPSAVSRFLNRFSRSKPSGPNPRNSLALSTDDIEFLSDIVPSANDETDEASQLRDLSNMLASPPLPSTLPPPLGPPPRVPTPKYVHQIPSTMKPAPSQLSSDDDILSLFDSPVGLNQPQPTPPPLPTPPTTSTNSAVPLVYRAPLKVDSRATSLSTYIGGRPSPSNSVPPSRKRTPVAIMSTGSSSSSKNNSFSPLPPPPILPPPDGRPMSRTSHSRQSSLKNLVDENFTTNPRSFTPPASPPSLLADTSVSSVFSDRSLISDTSGKSHETNGDLFDDFDDFVSSPIKDPSPPRPPAKPIGHQQITQQIQAIDLPPIRHPSPLPPLPHPHLNTAPSATSRNFIPTQQTNGSVLELSTSTSMAALPPPPGFTTVRTSTMSPQSLPFLQPTPSSNPMAQKVPSQPPPKAKYTPSVTPVASGGLSAQDLSFFEGI